MAWKRRNCCFQFISALIVQCLLVFYVTGECTDKESSNGEMGNAAAVELRRLVLNEIKSLRNDKLSVQMQLESISRNLESLRRNGSYASCSQETDRLKSPVLPRDCADVRARGQTESGIYRIFPIIPGTFSRRIETDVYCDMDSFGNGWLVIQKRMDGSVNFQRIWRDYTVGFGHLKGEFWLGNDLLNLLTSNNNYKLRIDMEDFEGEKRYAEYGTFSVGPAADKYRMTVSGYSGNADDSLSYHNGMQFSTFDSDNDKASGSCANAHKGGWWYNACHASNLNGRYLHGNHTSYADGVNWKTFRGHNYSLKLTEIKIAPIF